MFDSKRKKKKPVHFELIPMIDVMMILVLFLAIMAFLPSVQNAINVPLPTASKLPDTVKDKDLVLTIDKGTYTIKGKEVPNGQLVAVIKAAMVENPEVRVVIAANKDLQWDNIVAVLDLMRQNQIKNVAIATEPVE